MRSAFSEEGQNHTAMHNGPILALALVAGVLVFFASVIYFGLQTRKRNFAKSLELKAMDVWPLSIRLFVLSIQGQRF
jgi:hypothetical protein